MLVQAHDLIHAPEVVALGRQQNLQRGGGRAVVVRARDQRGRRVLQAVEVRIEVVERFPDDGAIPSGKCQGLAAGLQSLMRDRPETEDALYALIPRTGGLGVGRARKEGRIRLAVPMGLVAAGQVVQDIDLLLATGRHHRHIRSTNRLPDSLAVPPLSLR